ncbi:intermembrane phospholipid transport protein YdbH family protein [Salidesulfovibrio onnuriiensis]|uniref:intermembrane phospholipid transport protein YdbH family protein n=1 Tax=Salidesulfovibrio onnuriiensis TaxID=2583823 RepID=UPI0011C8A5EE|nr:YdbH domain-containing protein [Salidesulfovibrio onnuriiensis]
MARRALMVLPWLLALLLGAGWFLASWTPGYLEKLVPELARDMGLPLTEFHIRRAGLFSADIGPVQLGERANGLRLSNVRVEYTPASLKAKRVNAVVIEGIQLHCQYGAQGLRIPLLESLNLATGSSGEQSSLLPLPFDQLVLGGAMLDLELEGRSLAIPLMASVEPGDTSIRFLARLRPRDQHIELDGVYTPGPETLSVQVTAQGLRLGAWADLLPAPVKGKADLKLDAVLKLGPFQTILDSLVATLDLSLKQPDLAALGLPLKDDVAFHADVTGTTADFTLSLAGVTLPGTLSARPEENGWRVALNAGQDDTVTLPLDGRQAAVSGLRVSLEGVAGADAADFLLKASSKGVAVGREHRTGALRLELPLAWPAPEKGSAGTVSVTGIRTGKHRVGSLKASLWQQGLGAGMKGRLSSGLLPGLRLDLQGNYAAETGAGKLNFESSYTLPTNYDPSGLVPALAGYTVGGTMNLEGEARFGPDGLESQAALYLSGGSLANAESNLSMTGIRLIFEMPDLTELRSAPAQFLAFDRMAAGNIAVTNGRAAFQLEPRGVLLVEGGGFDWAGGKVSCRAFRVVPGRPEYDVTLLCNELRLSEILGQLGLAKAQGYAALSGELPVTWKNGQISFNGGFLHSTPGEGGTIQVEGMQSLLDSIPKGTPQRGQLELAQAAVKDFEYKWVRIKADTVGKDLLLRLSLDGRPKSTLPFVYRKEIGGFIHIEGDMKGSNFQGLRLDVNFSLPLDRILLYKELIKMIE